MKTAYLYCDPRSLNDATNYYLGLIKDCLIDTDYKIITAHKLRDITQPDLILTLTGRYFLAAKIIFPKSKTIFWAQGVSAEEAKLSGDNWKDKLRCKFRFFAEQQAVKKSDILFCVSEAQVNYYKTTYNYSDSNNCVVMPCYNLKLSNNFDENQYTSPTFVYAGNSSVWQGVDFMLDMFAIVQKTIHNARLIICTNDIKVFEYKIESRKIQNYEIKYVPVDKLSDEMHKYKYGLIIRDNHIVNHVATPTKMNSYLASYLIPIFSEGVDAFKRNIDLGEYTLRASIPLNAEALAKQIIEFENKIKDFSGFEEIVNNLFNRYYNDNRYKTEISRMIREHII